MQIGVPIAAYHLGSTADYVCSAFRELGHSCTVLNQAQFERAFRTSTFDLFFCVDSGEALSLTSEPFVSSDLSKVAFWYIDYRHNKDRPTRRPTDRENAARLTANGGVLFQSQYEDFQECAPWPGRVAWLPLAADPLVWQPQNVPKQFHLGFVGNVWDAQRLAVLEALNRWAGLRFMCAQPGTTWKEAAAQALSQCQAGFNVNSFFGSPFAFDVNMRVFETLSCGLPLITNEVPALKRLFPENVPFIRTYRGLSDLRGVVQGAFSDEQFLRSGREAREWILNRGTYKCRLEWALELIFERSRCSEHPFTLEHSP